MRDKNGVQVTAVIVDADELSMAYSLVCSITVNWLEGQFSLLVNQEPCGT
ncbi:hypothetical protein [Paenibacillus sp. 1011MAR3C5]|nr:hypothetical protein [Paenibacillus sp. 1011MAR3C5]